MNTIAITRNNTHNLRVHAVNEHGRPLCGGGFGAAAVQHWQTDLATPNCHRCLAILDRRANPQSAIRNPQSAPSLDYVI